MMVRGLFSLLTTVTSFGEELGTVGGVEMFNKGVRLMLCEPCVNVQVCGACLTVSDVNTGKTSFTPGGALNVSYP